MRGPGKYDDACTKARESTKAHGVVLIVMAGEHGSGFSVQGPLGLLLNLPEVLRDIANNIDKDFSV